VRGGPPKTLLSHTRERTCLLVEQTRAINRESLGPSVGRLSYDDLRQLDDALRLALALDG